MKKIDGVINKKALLIILLFTLIILLLPYIRLFFNPYLMASSPYYNLRIAEDMRDNFIIKYDGLSYSGRDYYFNLSDFILSKLYFIEFFIRWLPLVFGVATVFLFYRILELSKIKPKFRLLILAIFASSPVFIYMFSIFNYYFIAVFLNVLIAYLLLKNKFKISVIFICLVPLFNIKIMPITLLLLFTFFILKRKTIPFVANTISLILVTLIYYLLVIYPKFLPRSTFFIEKITPSKFVSDFGSFYGFSVFMLILALMGFFVLWTQKKKYFLFLITLIILILSSLYFPFVNIFSNFIFSFLAAVILLAIIKRRWQHKLIKNATLILIFCGLLFSTASFINRLIDNEPQPDQIESLIWLSRYSKSGEVILSHYSNGFFIEYFTERPVIMDELFVYAPNLEERFNDTNTLFYSRSLEQTTSLLDKYNVKYIWISKKMKSGLVWTKKDQGLLFLFRNKETFKNIYSYSDIEIWEYLK